MLMNVLLNDGEYALALGPGFFCFYAQLGILKAFDELGVFNPTHISGSSAGAVVGAFVASGLPLCSILVKLQELKRDDIWDIGQSLFGLLKGELLQQKLQNNLPVENIEDCDISFAASVWDILAFKTKIMSCGNIATAVRASCCFPVLFAPVFINNRPFYDGGFFDEAGLFGLQDVPESKLIVNIICGNYALKSSTLPEKFKDCRLLTLVMDNIPAVTPLDMHETGPRAYQYARLATLHAFSSGHIQQPSLNHWIVYIDGSQVSPTDILPTNQLAELKCKTSKKLIQAIHKNSGKSSNVQPFPFLAKSLSRGSINGSNANLNEQLVDSRETKLQVDKSNSTIRKRKKSIGSRELEKLKDWSYWKEDDDHNKSARKTKNVVANDYDFSIEDIEIDNNQQKSSRKSNMPSKVSSYSQVEIATPLRRKSITRGKLISTSKKVNRIK